MATIASLVLLGLAGPAAAWPGDPDGASGSCGTRTVDVVAGAASTLRAAAGAPDGKVLAAGAADGDALVMRLSAGAPDTTFGTAGWVRTGYAGATGRLDAVDATATGGAIAVGRRVSGSTTDSIIVAVKSNGKLDTSFKGTGRVVLDAGGDDAATAVAVAGDGGVFVAGNADSGGYVARYTAAGDPDPGWDGDGRRSGLALTVRALALRPDGSLYVGGTTTTTPGDWRVLRLAGTGSTDDGFGGSGGATVDAGGHDVATAMALQADGKLVVTGFGAGAAGHGQTMVRRFLADGTQDPAFTPYREAFGQDDEPTDVVAQDAGATVVTGNSRVGTDNDVVLLRLADDGTPDDDFGIDGATVSDLGRRSVAGGLAAPSAGKPLVVGSTRVGSREVASVFRYQDDGAAGTIPTKGLVLDAYGGLHGWSAGCLGAPTAIAGNPYWPGWDIARGVAVLPGSRGLVVDAYGGAKGFTFDDGAGNAPTISGGPYWPGWDIVRGVAVLPNGTGGFELDGYGGLHPFAIGSGSKPAKPTGLPYWSGMDIARGIALMRDGQGGYVVDASGGIHRFGGAPAVNAGSPYWAGQDVIRGIALSPSGSGGWLVDRFGGLHPFGTGGDPAPSGSVGGPYWSGRSLARGVATLP